MHIIDKIRSKDGKTQKFLQITEDKYITETTFVDYSKYLLCYSSQVGCPVACSFCYNGVNKNFTRNLTKNEMVAQCTNIIKHLDIFDKDKPIKFGCMGVGEPLLNYENVIDGITELDKKYPHSIFSLATTGVKPNLIPQLAKDIKDMERFILTFSLHASNDETRKKLIPMHQSMFTLRDAANKYKNITNHEMCWNYVLLDGVNDSDKNVQELSDFLEKGDTVKLTHYSPIMGSNLKSATQDKFKKFKEMLEKKGIEFYEFNPDGKDINAGCGQMAARKQVICDKEI